MKFNSIILFSAALAVLASASCKKDKDEDTFSDYMSGELRFTQKLPAYIEKGKTLVFTPTGITEPLNIGYYFYNTWNSQKDTTRIEGGSGDGTYTIKGPTELGEFRITCVGFAEGYYTTSGAYNFTVVDDEVNTSIKGAELTLDSYRVNDSRDDREYYSTREFPRWFKMNLAYSGSGVSYEESPVMDMLFGRYYTWTEAQTACPAGWALPTDADFAELASKVGNGVYTVHEDFKDVAGAFMVNASFLDERMWEYWPQVNISNKTGFCSIPTGYCVDMEGGNIRFSGLNSYAAYWTADEEGDNGFYRYIYVDKNDVLVGKGNKDSFRANVRCIRKN